MDRNMNYQEEIQYRKELMNKVHGEKLTPEERLWLSTHKVYNSILGYPYVNRDIVQLQPNVQYRMRIKLESVNYPDRIIPIISVAGKTGEILPTKAEYLLDLDENIVPLKPVKSYGILLDENNNESEVLYKSKLGLLDVTFECDYYDDKQRLWIRKSSIALDDRYAMISEYLAENKVLYRCKSPLDDTFDSLVFSIEWEEA